MRRLATDVAAFRGFRIVFALFFLSGCCSLTYQVVWLRQAFAAFGVITPVFSVVISVFMLGLAVGSWLGGRCAELLVERTRLSPMTCYGVIELMIGSGACLVPLLFRAGERHLLVLGEMGSASYLAASALVVSASILPWCIAMGATLPLAMAYIKKEHAREEFSFSFLYVANVMGAMCGSAVTALVLIELLGFTRTLYVAAVGNVVIAGVSVWLGQTASGESTSTMNPRPSVRRDRTHGSGLITAALFATGFTSMASEVVWTRAFTPVMNTTVYAFASVLTVYLLATGLGSYAYRRHLSEGHERGIAWIGPWLALAALLPLVLADPRLRPGRLQELLSIFPFSALLGYLTPKLVDDYSRGDPGLGGRAYSINVLGCVLGPLVAGYWMLPGAGVKWTVILLATPFLAYMASNARSLLDRRVLLLATLVVTVVAVFVSRTHEDGMFYRNAVVRRDYAGTVVSAGEGMERQLLVNGISMTYMTPITKIMAHLPLAMLSHPPESALVVCFGMGATFRSLMSWGIETTAVELVPSVREAFGYYFSDARQLLGDPRGRIVIDDGRRLLKRSPAKFDIITVDPPPPVEAAGSSLLYSTEFYEVAKARLKPGGILHQWFPGGEAAILHGVARAIEKSFPQVRVYRAIEGIGHHFLAGSEPFVTPSVEEMLARMPEGAKSDLMEWYPARAREDVVAEILKREISLERVLGAGSVLVSDDRPMNEFYMLRRQWERRRRHRVRFPRGRRWAGHVLGRCITPHDVVACATTRRIVAERGLGWTSAVHPQRAVCKASGTSGGASP